MNRKKIILSLVLLLLLSNCGGKNDDDSKNSALLLLALENQKKTGISGLYASLMASRNGNNGGALGNYSNGSVSPFAVVDESQPCPKSGSIKLSGNVNTTNNGNQFSVQFNDVKFTYLSCALTAPQIDSSNGASSEMLIDGEIKQNGTMTITLDPSSNQDLVKYSEDSVVTMSSDSYKVNGSLYPKFAITFTSNGSKTTIENASDMDKAVMTREETVRVTGSMGDEKIDTSFTFKSQFKLK
ncbi:sigma factor SigX-regulated lipoprotein [Leptospira adleri]|uniref:sigma factor SigX-regulated lipoprotein n=1 Tax=Leptospira adleri TaxID=2023186 RepID=UPI00108297F6|nr:hypothetical protein [Leptospira adleri]TGM52733.1 hypothetical protein EHQ97_12475 [Leptospira adleri]